jgi:inhibitor of KinA sporulation pathway (predicted exonuclease)
VASSDQFDSYVDRLRQKLINRLAHKTKNLTTVERTVSKSDHTPSVSEVYQTITVVLNRLFPERQLNHTDDSTTEVASISKMLTLKPLFL